MIVTITQSTVAPSANHLGPQRPRRCCRRELEAIATGVIAVLTPDGTRLLITDVAAVARDYDAALDLQTRWMTTE